MTTRPWPRICDFCKEAQDYWYYEEDGCPEGCCKAGWEWDCVVYLAPPGATFVCSRECLDGEATKRGYKWVAGQWVIAGQPLINPEYRHQRWVVLNTPEGPRWEIVGTGAIV